VVLDDEFLSGKTILAKEDVMRLFEQHIATNGFDSLDAAFRPIVRSLQLAGGSTYVRVLEIIKVLSSIKGTAVPWLRAGLCTELARLLNDSHATVLSLEVLLNVAPAFMHSEVVSFHSSLAKILCRFLSRPPPEADLAAELFVHLGNLAYYSEAIIEAGAIPPLLRLVKMSPRVDALLAITLISQDIDAQQCLLECKALPILASQLESPDEFTTLVAVSCFEGLAKNPSLRHILCDMGVIRLLMPLCASRYEDTSASVIRCLSHLILTEKSHALISSADGLKTLAEAAVLSVSRGHSSKRWVRWMRAVMRVLLKDPIMQYRVRSVVPLVQLASMGPKDWVYAVSPLTSDSISALLWEYVLNNNRPAHDLLAAQCKPGVSPVVQELGYITVRRILAVERPVLVVSKLQQWFPAVHREINSSDSFELWKAQAAHWDLRLRMVCWRRSFVQASYH
jgi:hypothetical protein